MFLLFLDLAPNNITTVQLLPAVLTLPLFLDVIQYKP